MCKKKLKKSFITNNKNEGVFVFSYSVLIFILMCLKFKFAAISTLNASYEFLYLLESQFTYFVISNFKRVDTITLFLNNSTCKLPYCFLYVLFFFGSA